MQQETSNKSKLFNKMKNAERYVNFIKTTGNPPNVDAADNEERKIANFKTTFISRAGQQEKYPEVTAYLAYNGVLSTRKEQMKKIFIDWVTKHKRAPKYSSEEDAERLLCKWAYNHDYKDLVAECVQLGLIDPTTKKGRRLFVISEKELDKLIDWIKENKKVPTGYKNNSDEEKDMAAWYQHFKKKANNKDSRHLLDRLETFLDQEIYKNMQGIVYEPKRTESSEQGERIRQIHQGVPETTKNIIKHGRDQARQVVQGV